MKISNITTMHFNSAVTLDPLKRLGVGGSNTSSKELELLEVYQAMPKSYH